MKNCDGSGDDLRRRILATSQHYQVHVCFVRVPYNNVCAYICVCSITRGVLIAFYTYRMYTPVATVTQPVRNRATQKAK